MPWSPSFSLGRFAGSVGHTSSGGEEFRDDLLGRQFAGVVGRELAAHLLVRDIAGLTLLDDAMVGWASAEQCRRAAERIAAFEPDDDVPEDLWVALDGVVAGAERGTGLVTVYT